MRPVIRDYDSPLWGRSGLWRVSTETADYLLDLTAGTALRTPREADAAALRRDGEDVTLHEVYTCQVGKPLTLIVTGVAEGSVGTVRYATTVRAIEHLVG